MNTLSSPSTPQTNYQPNSTLSFQPTTHLQLTNYAKMSSPLQHDIKSEWSHTPPATPIAPSDRMQHAMMTVQSDLQHQQHQQLDDLLPFTDMSSSSMLTSLDHHHHHHHQDHHSEDEYSTHHELLAHHHDMVNWHFYADSADNELKLNHPKSPNQSFHPCVTATSQERHSFLPYSMSSSPPLTTATTTSSSISPFYVDNHHANHHYLRQQQEDDDDENATTTTTTTSASTGRPMLCNTLRDQNATLLDPISSIASRTSSVVEENLFSDGDQDTLSTASSLFGHLSKAQLIERVVQLEQEKRRTTSFSSSTSSLPSTSSSGRVSETQSKIKKKTSQDDTSNSSTSQEQDIHLCRWVNCRTETNTLDELIIHLRDTHIGSGKAAYHCEWIGCARNKKPFMKRHKMHNHLRTHTGERPFVCTVTGCEKRFSRPDSLNTHIRTHSNIRPYLCPVENCTKAYFHSRSLRKHVKGHEAAGIIVPRPAARISALNRKKHQPPRTTLSTPSPEHHKNNKKSTHSQSLLLSSLPSSIIIPTSCPLSSPKLTHPEWMTSSRSSLSVSASSSSLHNTGFSSSSPSFTNHHSENLASSPSSSSATATSVSSLTISPSQLCHNYVPHSSSTSSPLLSSPSTSSSPSSSIIYASNNHHHHQSPLSDPIVMNCSPAASSLLYAPFSSSSLSVSTSSNTSSYVYALTTDYDHHHPLSLL